MTRAKRRAINIDRATLLSNETTEDEETDERGGVMITLTYDNNIEKTKMAVKEFWKELWESDIITERIKWLKDAGIPKILKIGYQIGKSLGDPLGPMYKRASLQ